jgi:hypothetical protein
MDELAELGVHVNNEGEFPVFSLGVKETAYGPSALVAGAPFLRLPSTVELSKLTTVVDLPRYRNLLVLRRAKGGSVEAPASLLHMHISCVAKWLPIIRVVRTFVVCISSP